MVKPNHRRLDLIIEKAVDSENDPNKLSVRLRPNPERYNWVNQNGEIFLLDKFDKSILSKEQVISIIQQMSESGPLDDLFLERKIENINDYIMNRGKIVKAKLKGEYQEKSSKKPTEVLEDLLDTEFMFVIMCVDIVSSTKLSTIIEPKIFNKMINIILYEISDILPQFHGHILKYTGDGVIAYFAEPSFIINNDLALDCALAIKRLIYDVINPIFFEINYEPIDIRIGLDSGDAFVTKVGSPNMRQDIDLIGSVVNFSSKIQSLANPGDILLGDITEKNLHTKWRKYCENVELPEGWNYKILDKIYKVHRFKDKDFLEQKLN